MADTKITALTAITTVDPANDVLPIVDVSDTSMAASGTTKKITTNQLLGASGTATLASATISGDLTVDTSTLKVDSANDRVGIGIATPAWPLDIRSATAVAQILSTTGTNAAYLQVSNTGGIFYLGRENSAGTSFASPAYSAVLYAGGAYPLVTTVNGSERYRIASDGVATWSNVGGVAGTAMTLNSTGLGVGVSPAFKLSAAGVSQFYAESDGIYASGNLSPDLYTIGVNYYNAAGTEGVKVSARPSWKIEHKNSSDALAYLDIGFRAASAAASAFTSRFKIDGSGNVGIGVTPSVSKLHVGITSTATSGLAEANALKIENNNATVNNAAGLFLSQTGDAGCGIAGIATSRTGGSRTSALALYYYSQATSASPIEGARLDASGNLLVGKTASSSTVVGAELRPSGAIISTLAASTNADFALYTYSTGAGAARFYVGMSGTVFATNTTISAISDARLKENVQDIDVGLGAILALKPRKFDWKEGKGKNIKGDRGFIAQEVEQVFPQLVDEWADPAPEGEVPYKSVRQDLIPVLVKAIQELAARVQTLETR